MTSRSRTLVKALAAVTALASLSACQTSTHQRWEETKSDPTPKLKTLTQREYDQENAMTVTSDENLRMMGQDLGRFFLTDRPSRLTREPIPR